MKVPFSQTSEYLELLRHEGHQPFYIKIDESNFLLAFKSYKRVLGFKIPFFYKVSAYEGIVYNNEEKLGLLLNKLHKVIESPFSIRAQVTIHPEIKIPNGYRNFFNGSYYTYLLNLRQFPSAEEYLGSLPQKLRASIRKCTRQGLTVKEVSSEEDLDTYLNFVNDNRISNSIPSIPEEHFRKSWDLFSENKAVRYFIIYKGDTPLASQGVNVSLNCLTLVQTTTSKKCYELKIRANDLLQYSMVELGINEGFDSIDWGGAQPNSDDPKMIAIDHFKRKWGGSLVETPALYKGF